jgi:predicted  nucleic acid-binding Zn-ribbon protein
LLVHPAIPLLLELQRTDQEIASFRTELEAAPKRIRENDAKLNANRAALAAAKQAHALAVAARKKAELDVAEWRERARKFRSQSSAVKTNEAYKALQHEIANADAETAKAEDAQLEQMMAVEEAEKRVKAEETTQRDSEQSVAAERREIENRARETKKRMNAANSAREELAKLIPEEALGLYARQAKRHHGVALAKAHNEQCRGCGMRLLPHTYQEVHRRGSQELLTCENCGRILYAAEPATPAANPSAASAT